MRSNQSSSNDTITNILYFAAGLSLGAAVGILVAPASGKDTRRYLGDRAGAAREYLDYGRDLYEKGRELADEAATMYEDGRHLIER
ncbi:MAG TPA: YtxH domain-containing protein [Bryobacteraceae bacterium]|nr:YtxH domain-containing protein [Bryobacteraceae bacterium]